MVLTIGACALALSLAAFKAGLLAGDYRSGGGGRGPAALALGVSLLVLAATVLAAWANSG